MGMSEGKMRIQAWHRRQPGGQRARVLAAMSLALAATLALASCDGSPFAGFAAAGPPPRATATATPPAADANAAADQGPDARSFSLGCAPDAPRPLPRVITGGGY